MGRTIIGGRIYWLSIKDSVAMKKGGIYGKTVLRDLSLQRTGSSF